MSVTTTTGRFTYDDLLTTRDDGNRYEIIDGELIVSAAPLVRHQRMLYLLLLTFAAHVEPRRLGHLYFGPLDVVFGPSDVVEPDLIYVRRSRFHIFQDRAIHIGLSTERPISSLKPFRPQPARDLGRKLVLYKTEGVAEYWIADPETPNLMLFVLNAAGGYEQVHPIDGRLHSRVLPGFAIDLERLFADLHAE